MNLCDACGKECSEMFSNAYRAKEVLNGRLDPGLLCGSCAGKIDGGRIGASISGVVEEAAQIAKEALKR